MPSAADWRHAGKSTCSAAGILKRRPPPRKPKATEEGLHAAQVGLLAQVATNYLELRGVQQRTGILQKNIELQRERLRALQAFL